jgi:transcriptional regulator with XRE-family HTH domain
MPLRERSTPAAVEVLEAQCFAANVKRLRGEQGLSQEKLGQMAGIRQAEISKLEAAFAVPSLGTVARVAAAFGKRAYHLLVP